MTKYSRCPLKVFNVIRRPFCICILIISVDVTKQSLLLCSLNTPRIAFCYRSIHSILYKTNRGSNIYVFVSILLEASLFKMAIANDCVQMVETLCLSNTHNTTMQESIRMTYIKLFKRKNPQNTNISANMCKSSNKRTV